MLDRKLHYMQVALNSNLAQAESVINTLPASKRILLEAGTPLIKQYGDRAIKHIKNLWTRKMIISGQSHQDVYVVADMKCMDRGEREVSIAASAGASATVVLGLAPIETIDAFIKTCNDYQMDSMLDMMNVNEPYKILCQLKKLPTVVTLHRGVDEEHYSDKPLPIQMINKIKGTYDVIIAVAGGDTSREIQSSVFNGADIVVLWKNFYQASADTGFLATEFLRDIK